jgi:hypothetical protein
MEMCRRCWGLCSGCSWGISFTRIGASTFDELRKQSYQRSVIELQCASVRTSVKRVHWLTSVHEAKDGLCTCTLTLGSISICMVTYLTTCLHALQLPKEVVLLIAEICRSSQSPRTRYRELDTAYNSMDAWIWGIHQASLVWCGV